MAENLATKLNRVQTAIEKLESGAVSSYEIENRKVTYHNLSQLYKREQDLLKQIDIFGRDYIPGNNTKPTKRTALVSFS